jgi:uncharacterized membrane protein
MAGVTVPADPRRGVLLLCLAAALAVGVVLRFWNLGHANLDFDETFSAMAARLPVGKLFHFLRYHDSHPPLDYLVRKPFVGHTTSAWWIRFPSALLSVAALLALAGWMRRVGRLGVITVALAAISSFALTYARDARMYAAMTAVGAVCAWAAWQWLRTGSRAGAAAAGATLLLGLFLHSSALFLAVGLFLVPGLDRSRLAWWWRASVTLPVVVWVVAWGPSFRYQAGHNTASWIAYTRPDYLSRVLNEMVDSYPGIRLLVVALLVVGAVLVVRRDRAVGRVFVLCFVVPIGLIAAVGIGQHILLPRTLAFAAWAPMLALAAVIDTALERSRPMGIAVGALVAVAMVPSTLDAVRPSQPGPAAVLSHTAAVAHDGDVVGIHPDWLGPLVRWRLGVARPGIEHPRRRAGLDADLLLLGDAPATGRIWLIEPTVYDAHTPGLRACAQPWERDGYRVLCLAAFG